MPSNLQGIEITDRDGEKYNFEIFKRADNQQRGVSIGTKDWEIGEAQGYWKVPLFPFDGGLRQDRLPISANITTDFNRARTYSKANADASWDGILVPPPATDSLSFPNNVTVTKQENYAGKQFFLCGRYIISVDRNGAIVVDKDFGSGKEAVDMEVFNNELIVAMGESERIWRRDGAGTWTQSSEDVFAIALGKVGTQLWRAESINKLSNAISNPLTLGSWTPSSPNQYTAGDTTHSIHGIIDYGGVPWVLRPDGVFAPDSKSEFHNQAPQIHNWPHADNGKGAFVAHQYLWVPTVAGLLRITIGESLVFGPEKSNRPDFRFWTRGGVEWGEAIYLVVTDELNSADTFICKMVKNSKGYAENPYIYHEWKRLGSATKSYTIGINTWPSTGPVTINHDAGTAADLAGIGTITWGSPTNALVSNDLYATAAAGVSHYLRYSNFSFNIPAAADILGVAAYLERKTSVSALTATSNNLGTMASAVGGGSTHWVVTGTTTLTGTFTSDVPGSLVSHHLRMTNWGLAVPANAIITKVQFTIRRQSFGGPISDYSATLTYNGLEVVSNNQADGSLWPVGIPDAKTFGGGVNAGTWGVTLTPAIVNHATFGFDLTIGSNLGADGAVSEAYGAFQCVVTYTVNGTVDNVISLVDGTGLVIGENKASATSWPSADATVQYGDINDTWSAGLVPADITNDFGFVVAVTNPTGVTASVDYGGMSITYQEHLVNRPPSLFAGFGSGVERVNLGTGAGRDIDDPTYSFGSDMEVESGTFQPVQDVTLQAGLIGISIVMKIREGDSFSLYYAKEGEGYKNLLNTQEGSGTLPMTDDAGVPNLYQQYTRYAPPNTTNAFFKTKLVGTLAAASGTNRPEIRAMWAYGYARPKVTDLIKVPIYLDRNAMHNGISQGETGGEMLRRFRAWKRDQTVFTLRFPDYETVRTIRARVYEVEGDELISDKQTDGTQREIFIATVIFMRDDFANQYGNE